MTINVNSFEKFNPEKLKLFYRHGEVEKGHDVHE